MPTSMPHEEKYANGVIKIAFEVTCVFSLYLPTYKRIRTSIPSTPIATCCIYLCILRICTIYLIYIYTFRVGGICLFNVVFNA